MKAREWLLKYSQIEILMRMNCGILSGATCIGECFGVEKSEKCEEDGCFKCIQKVLNMDIPNTMRRGEKNHA